MVVCLVFVIILNDMYNSMLDLALHALARLIGDRFLIAFVLRACANAKSSLLLETSIKLLVLNNLVTVVLLSDGIQGVLMGSCEPVLGMPG